MVRLMNEYFGDAGKSIHYSPFTIHFHPVE
jgi:hypothetical protein